jgi:hypothetical protein
MIQDCGIKKVLDQVIRDWYFLVSLEVKSLSKNQGTCIVNNKDIIEPGTGESCICWVNFYVLYIFAWVLHEIVTIVPSSPVVIQLIQAVNAVGKRAGDLLNC